MCRVLLGIPLRGLKEQIFFCSIVLMFGKKSVCSIVLVRNFEHGRGERTRAK